MVFGHTSYLINPGAKNRRILKKSIQALSEELSRADQLGLPFLVLHPGAHMGDGEETGLDRVVSALDTVFASLPEGKCKVALEITAGQGLVSDISSSISRKLSNAPNFRIDW